MRRDNDYYPTESRLTNGLLSIIENSIIGHIVEPCNGKGHISNILKNNCLHVTTSDIIEGSDYQGDARSDLHFERIIREKGNIDWIITNVPFKDALPIIKTSRKHAKHLAILVRLSFLEPTYDRQYFLQTDPPTMIIVCPRSSFTGDGKTDSVTTAWLIWGLISHKPIQIIRK